jgi:hypothetical protein
VGGEEEEEGREEEEVSSATTLGAAPPSGTHPLSHNSRDSSRIDLIIFLSFFPGGSVRKLRRFVN